jgi:hypothetical protein
MRAHHVGVFVAFFANDSINARKPSSPTRAIASLGSGQQISRSLFSGHHSPALWNDPASRVSRHDEKDLERAFLGDPVRRSTDWEEDRYDSLFCSRFSSPKAFMTSAELW